MIDKNKLIKKIYDGVRIVASKRARNSEQAKDFMQEGLIAALEAIDRYIDKDEADIIRIISRAAYNRIKDMIGREVVYSGYVTSSVIEEYTPDTTDWYSEVDTRFFYNSLMARLNSTQRKVLKRKLHPSSRVLKEWKIDNDEKRERKAGGKLVMGLDKVEIKDIHIARSMGMSKATISRINADIRSVALTLLEDQPPEQSEKALAL